MAIEQFANGGSSTLSSGINNSVTSLVVVATTNMPTVGNFRILIDTELLLVTAVSGTTLTVTRGIEGTTAASHSSAATVTHILTSGSLIQAFADYISKGTYASLPAAGRAGRMYLCTDVPYTLYDNGTTWDAFYQGQAVVIPPSSGWSWVNQSTATITSNGYQLLYMAAGAANGNNIRTRTAPSTPYTIDIFHTVQEANLGYWGTCFGWRNSSNGKLVLYRIGLGNSYASGYPGYALNSYKWDSATSANAAYTAPTGATSIFKYPQWVRLKDDGTNLSIWFSYDNINYAQLDTNRTRTDFITSGPTDVCFGVTGNTGPVSNNIISWNSY